MQGLGALEGWLPGASCAGENPWGKGTVAGPPIPTNPVSLQPQARTVGPAKGTQLHHSLSMGPPANYFAGLRLSFHICKMGMIIPIGKS